MGNIQAGKKSYLVKEIKRKKAVLQGKESQLSSKKHRIVKIKEKLQNIGERKVLSNLDKKIDNL